MAWTLVFLSLLSYFSCINSQPTLTQPVSQSGSLGGTIKLTCAISRSPDNVRWIQQRSLETPRFVHCDTCSNRGPGIPDRFTATRSDNNGYLTITNLQAEDEADYYCFMWYSNTYVFGSGTQLSISGQDPKSPTVQVFPPSLEEVRNPNPFTSVCLLTDFYPPLFEVRWKCDNKVVTSGVDTSKATKQGGTYVASSYMRLTAPEYEKCNTFTCEVTHERKTISKTASKSGSC